MEHFGWPPGLSGEKDIVIRAEDGTVRRRARYMRDTDWIERNRQRSLFKSPEVLAQ